MNRELYLWPNLYDLKLTELLHYKIFLGKGKYFV